MYRDTMDTRYILGEDATPLVQRGGTVAAGDVIASVRSPAALVPYAALLRLSPDAAAAAIIQEDGAACIAGASLGARRIGLLTHSVAAPASGEARSLPKSGALAIRSEGRTFYRAHYAGTVRDSHEKAIVITSDIVRCAYVFADERSSDGVLHIEQALLRAANAEETIQRLPQAASSTVIAHISDADRLGAMARSFDGTLIVGSVTEPVALALWERSLSPASRHRKGADIVVLDGVGDMEDGVRVVAPLAYLEGAAVIIERLTQTITIIPSSGLLPSEVFPMPDSGYHGERRDPAHYRVSCDAIGEPTIAMTSSGTRALCVTAIGETTAERGLPMHNLQRLPLAGD